MKRLLLAAAAVLGLTVSSASMARVDVDISIGVPGVRYSQPDYYYPPVRYVERPRVIVVPERSFRPVRSYEPRYYSERMSKKHYKHYKKNMKRHHRQHGRGHHYR
jgi:hypothetical protein